MNLNNFFISSYYTEGDDLNSYLSGPSVDLVDYLKGKNKDLIYFRFPLFNQNKKKKIIIEFIKGSLTKKKIINFTINDFFLKKDYSNSLITITYYKILEIYFLVKIFNKVKKINKIVWSTDSIQFLSLFLCSLFIKNYQIYDVIDFTPRRYLSKFMNNIFFILDRLSCKFSNLILCQTERVLRFRAKKIGKNIVNKHHTKFSGIDKKLFIDNPDKFNENSIVYVGLIAEQYGIDLLIEAIHNLKNKPKNLLVDIYGPIDSYLYYENLIKLINHYDLGKYINFKGPIYDKIQVQKICSKYSLGLALYKKDKNIITSKFFGSVNKIPMYFASSLPVLSSYLPIISKDIKNKKLGLVSGLNLKEVSNNLNYFFQLSLEKKIDLRKNSFNFINTKTWQNIYDEILIRIQNEF